MSSWMFLLDLDRAPGAPLAILPANTDDPAGWALERRDALREAVVEHGAVLVRGLGLRDRTEVGAVFAGLTGGLMTEKEAFAPRKRYPGGIYSSTRWPASLPMCMHHELSYVLEVPGLLLFACLTAPVEGGATALADARPCSRPCPPSWSARFEREGWLLTRSYNGEIGTTFAEAFGTETARGRALLPGQRDRVRVAARRRAAHPAAPPRGGAAPRHRPAVLVQPDRVPQRVDHGSRGARVPGRRLREDGLPFNTCFGDGDPIDEDVVALLNDVYEAHTCASRGRTGT